MGSPTVLFILIILIIVLTISAISDITFQKIPNWLTIPTMTLGVVYYTWMNGTEGFLYSVEGIGVGVVVLILPYILGGMGAGDIKLMGAVGSLLGPKGVFTAFLFTAIIGGIYALLVLVLSRNLRNTVKRYGTMLKTFVLTQTMIYIPPSREEMKPRLCYGVAIALGTILSVFYGSINIYI
jgi:prepilin peptidase CpaA